MSMLVSREKINGTNMIVETVIASDAIQKL